MPTNRITLEEIIIYQGLRDLGLSVRAAAEDLGRSPSGMHKYDIRRKPKSEAPDLELEIIRACQAEVAKLLPNEEDYLWFFVHNPALEAKVRSLANSVKRAIAQIEITITLVDQP